MESDVIRSLDAERRGLRTDQKVSKKQARKNCRYNATLNISEYVPSLHSIFSGDQLLIFSPVTVYRTILRTLKNDNSCQMQNSNLNSNSTVELFLYTLPHQRHLLVSKNKDGVCTQQTSL